MIRIRLFASIRERLGRSEEQLAATGITTVAGVRSALIREHGPRWQEVLEADQVVVAINQEVADWNSPVGSGDEVAFFPPVTGG